MKRSLRITALFLSLLLAVTPLVACRDGEDATDAATETTTETAATTEAGSETTAVTETDMATESDTESKAEMNTETETEPETEAETTPSVERVQDTRNLTAAQYSILNITGTDDFGRVINPVDGKLNSDRYVGMFFFLTLGQHPDHNGIYDINKITYDSTYPEAFKKYSTPLTPAGAAHFWGEPVFGYYNSLDPWVMRKQVEMLTMAGVDFLVLDTTNNVLYPDVTALLFSILKEYQDDGWDVPRVVYYLGDHSNLTADLNAFKQAYSQFYSNATYKSLWFTPNDPEKPMVIAPESVIAALSTSENAQEKQLASFYDFRVTQWPNEGTLHENGAPWIDFTYPQTSQNGWISLSTAQHVTTNMSDTENSRGRGWTPKRKNRDGTWWGTNNHTDWRQDLNFQAQWNTVLNMTQEQRATDARFVFLTGWNEWVAGKLTMENGTYFTCDTYNPEFSRDIEPTRSLGLKDYSYFMTIMNIHNDNFASAVHYEYPAATPDITKDDTAVWSTSQAVYRDFTGECADRNFKNMAGTATYTDTTGRNDLDTITLLHDDDYLYVRVTCVDDITAYQSGDTGWMNLWIKTSHASGDLMGGYEYVINREVSGDKSQILRCCSEDDLRSVGEADLRVYGNAMILRIPLSSLGLSSDDLCFEFKVTDNVQDMINDPLNLYSTGDAAPIGSLNFSYGY